MAVKSMFAVGSRSERAWRLLNRRSVVPYYYLLPTLVPLLALTLYSFLRGIYLAFTDYSLYTRTISFVGVANLVALLTNDIFFWGSLTNNVIWTINIVFITYVLGLFTALALNESIPLRALFRGIALIPWVCPAVVAGLTWRWIYDPNFDLLNFTFHSLSLIDRNVG